MIGNLRDIIDNVYVIIYSLSRFLSRSAPRFIASTWVLLLRCLRTTSRIWTVKWILSLCISSAGSLNIITASSSGITLSARVGNKRLIVSRIKVLHPWVGPEISSRWPIISICLHALGDDSSGTKWYMIGYSQLACNNFRIQLLVILAFVRELTAEEGV